MTRQESYRRVALLCCHCTRNLAFYRAGRKDDGSLLNKSDFGATVNNNFIDVAVLEWCKLFGNDSEKHHWKNIVKSKTFFRNELLAYLKTDIKSFRKFWKKSTTYRNRFLAHLDSDETMLIPEMEFARMSVSFYYDHIVRQLDQSTIVLGYPRNLTTYYNECMRHADANYSRKYATKN